MNFMKKCEKYVRKNVKLLKRAEERKMQKTTNDALLTKF